MVFGIVLVRVLSPNVSNPRDGGPSESSCQVLVASHSVLSTRPSDHRHILKGTKLASEFDSACAQRPETLYVEDVVFLNENDSGHVVVALGLGFAGFHYVDHPNAFIRGDNNYAGAYKDVARLVNRWFREPSKSVSTVLWPDVVEWTLDAKHGEFVARTIRGSELRFLPQWDNPELFYDFGVQAHALSSGRGDKAVRRGRFSGWRTSRLKSA